MSISSLLFSWMAPLAMPDAFTHFLFEDSYSEDSKLTECNLTPQAHALALESHAFLWGDTKRYFELREHSPDIDNGAFGRWRSLLFVIFATRAGLESQKNQAEHQLLAALHKSKDEPVCMAHAIYASSRMMGRGDFRGATVRIQSLITQAHHAPNPILDSFWEFWARSILGTCLQAQGAFDAAAREVGEQERIARRLPHPYFVIAWKRRNVSLLVERDEFADARERIKELLATVPASKFAAHRCLILQERIRIAFVDDDLQTAAATLDEVDTLMREQGLSASFVSFVEERCELDLRMNRPAPARRRIQARLIEAQQREDIAGRCVSNLFLARALLLSRHYRKAHAAALESLDLAERNGYAKVGIRVQLLLAAIGYRQGRIAGSVGFAVRANAGARHVGLEVQASCARILSNFIATRRVAWATLLELVNFRSGVGEVFHALDLCGFISENQVVFELVGTAPLHSFEVPLREAVKFIMATPAAFWFPAESLIVTTAASEARKTIFDERNFASSCFRYLLNETASGKRGAGLVTLELIHRLRWPEVEFHPIRHRAACQAALARLRILMGVYGFTLAPEPGHGTYTLATSTPWYQVTVRTSPKKETERAATPSSAPASVGLSKRELEIVALLQKKGRLETRELRALLGNVTRQTLHPMLKRLDEMGIVERVSNGPRTRYRLALPIETEE